MICAEKFTKEFSDSVRQTKFYDTSNKIPTSCQAINVSLTPSVTSLKLVDKFPSN